MPNTSPFNSPLESGVRTLAVLVASFPRSHDLRRLVQYDYLTVHSADADGPPSLHQPLPMRSGELLVRRGIIESGLNLMMSRSLVKRNFSSEGILYCAEEEAESFLSNLRSPYTLDLRTRATWVAETFDELSVDDLESRMSRLFEAWTAEFQPIQLGPQAELL